MKSFWGLLIMAIFLLCFSFTQAIAQVVDTTGVGNFSPADDLSGLSGWLNWYHALYGALVIGWGYLAKAFGLKAKVSNFVFVVAAGAAVLAGAFLALGFSKAFPLVFSFLSAIGIYDLIFKPFSPKRQLPVAGS